MILFTLLPRLLKRSGARLLLAWSSLVIGALTLAIILGLIGSVERFFVSESRTLLGGDISIESNAPIDRDVDVLTLLAARGAVFSERIETLVVVQSGIIPREGRISSLLVSLKVVDSNYPIYGELGLATAGGTTPTKDEVFVAKDVLSRMGIAVGDTIVIGTKQFTIANIIINEPDRVGGSFRLGPLLVLSHDGWSQTGLSGKQSRVDHILSIRFPDSLTVPDAALTTASLKNIFQRPTYSLSVASDGPRSLLRILDAAERFFISMIVLALFLVIVNIRLNLTYFLAAFQSTIAIMRSLGMRRSQLLLLFAALLFLLSVSAALFGTILGNILANFSLPYAETYTESVLPRVALLGHVGIVVLFTLFLCLCSALGFMMRILAIEPKLLLLGYGGEHGTFSQLKNELPMLLLTLLGFYGGVYYLTERAIVALIAVGSITGIFILLFLFSRGAIVLGHRLRFTLSFPLRSIMNFLKHQGMLSTTAVASLTIALASVFAIALLETNMLGNLRKEFRADAPNIYLIDIQEDQLLDVRRAMGPTWKDFSVVRARFTERDGYDIQANLDKENGELRREFNVTAKTEFIEGEQLIDGVWHGTSGTSQVSVERDFAERAKLALGTRVKFEVQGFPVEATVTSIREVTTTSGLPFFFLVFSPDVLANFPHTSFGYAYAATEEIPLLQNQLAAKYPNITSIPTTQILETAGKIVGALSGAVMATTIPSLVLGFILIIAMLAISARERANDMLVFTAFGARMRLLFKLFLIESGTVVLISGIFAALISHIGVYILNSFVFDFNGFYFSTGNGYLSIGVMVVTLLITYLFSRRFFGVSPAELLRKNG